MLRIAMLSLAMLAIAVTLATPPQAEAGLLSNIIGRFQRPSSGCPGGDCGVSAVKPMPLPAKPLPSATNPVKPMAPKPTIVK